MSIITGLVLSGLIFGSVPQIVWQAEPDPVLEDRAYGLALCPDQEALVVAGELDQDIGVYKLSRDNGDSLWLELCDNEGGEDIGYDVAIAPNGVVFVGATSTTETEPKLFVCGYSDSGELLWTKLVSARGQNGIPALYCRHPDSCYLAGWHFYIDDTYPDFFIFKEDGTSNLLWSTPAPGDYALTGVDVDTAGQVYLSSSARVGIRLNKRNAAGANVWDREYDDADASSKGWQCRVAPTQEVYLCGQQYRGITGYDFLLLKWSSEGTPLWPHGKYYDLGSEERCRDFALDSISDCYLAGWQESGEEEDVALIKTDSAGNMLWAWIDSLEGDQRIEGIEVDEEGYIYLAGSHHNGSNWDMLVMKVRQPLTISGRVTDSAGAPMVGIPVSLAGDTTVEVLTDTGGYYFIEVYNGGEYTVEPDKPGWVFTPSSHTYNPLSHREFNQDFSNGRRTSIEERIGEASISLQCNSSFISFGLLKPSEIKLTIYDVAGRELCVLHRGFCTQGEHRVKLPELNPGIYLVRLVYGDKVRTAKFVIRS